MLSPAALLLSSQLLFIPYNHPSDGVFTLVGQPEHFQAGLLLQDEQHEGVFRHHGAGVC